MATWQDNFRSVRDCFQHQSPSASDLWYGTFCVSGDFLKYGQPLLDLVGTRERLARKPAYSVGPANRQPDAEGARFLFGDPQALEGFMALGNAAYSALLGSPFKDIADSVDPPRSPRERFPCWLDVLVALAERELSPLLSIRRGTVSEGLGSWTDPDPEESGGFVHVATAFLEQNVFVASAAAIGGLLGDERPARRRTGRPRKGESDKERLVISALAVHHEWQSGGSVGNHDPAKTARLAALASGEHVEVSVATVSRFFHGKFPGRGYKGYQAACTRGEIGLKLALWQADVSEHLADLLPHESGRDDD